MKFIKGNWFKIALVIILSCFLFILHDGININVCVDEPKGILPDLSSC